MRIALKGLRWTVIAGLWLAIGLGAVLAWYAHDLPDITDLASGTRRPGITVIATDGTPLAAFGDLYGEPLTLADLPPYLPQALLAVEDRRFFSHGGIDPRGIARALWTNLTAGAVVEGGSTLTQQLAKTLFLTSERSLDRKIKEALLALWLEQEYSKDELLTLYLNRVYFGAGTFGVDAAARRYFGHSAREVSLYEAALLAGLPKAPSAYNPLAAPEKAASRAEEVLTDMVSAGFLAPSQARGARAKGAPSQIRKAARAPYFADWVLDRLPDYLGRIDRDLTVRTTLAMEMQQAAEGAVADFFASGRGQERGVDQAALLAMSPEGAVRALVGGRRYAESQFNRATQGRRQPGSTFKLFVYLAALEAGWTPAQRLVDEPIRLGDWQPRNAGDRYYGAVTLKEAFARSSNAIAVKLQEAVGRERVQATAERLGLPGASLPDQPSLALGTGPASLLSMTAAYASLANGGLMVLPYGITRISDRDGLSLHQRRAPSVRPRLIDPDHVATLTDLLRAVVTWGTGRDALLPGAPVAGKTGTSQGGRDAWFIGFTPDLVAGVWLGRDDNGPTRASSADAAQLWRDFMRRTQQPQPVAGPSLAQTP